MIVAEPTRVVTDRHDQLAGHECLHRPATVLSLKPVPVGFDHSSVAEWAIETALVILVWALDIVVEVRVGLGARLLRPVGAGLEQVWSFLLRVLAAELGGREGRTKSWCAGRTR